MYLGDTLNAAETSFTGVYHLHPLNTKEAFVPSRIDQRFSLR